MYNGHNAYLESRILSADPIELVNMLYQACTGAVREARHHLAKGEDDLLHLCIVRARNQRKISNSAGGN